MSQVPADKSVGRLRGQQHFWGVMVALQRFTLSDIADWSNAGRDTIRDYVLRLCRSGHVRATGTDPKSRAVTYEVAIAAPEAPRVTRDGQLLRSGSGTEQMWRTMKMRGTFSADELATGASTAEVQVSVMTARDYCVHLHRAGYLAVSKAPRKSGGRTVYRLVRNTGPKAPMIQRVKRVFDPNLNAVIWTEGTE